MKVPTIEWGSLGVRLLDQTRLPREVSVLELDELEGLCEAIASLRVRGAPAIGIAGAYGLAQACRLCAQERFEALGPAVAARADASASLSTRLHAAAHRLRDVRPTAINLAWAVDRVWDRLDRAWRRGEADPKDAHAALEIALEEARAIHEEDLEASRAMGREGAELVPRGARILTHCNTGGLATGGLGTALAVVFEAARQGKDPLVYVAETRPLLQGARLTAWELERAGIRASLLVDGARAHLMATTGCDLVLVGADRVAANGDTANKIGTLAGAVAAKRYGVSFYVVAPTSTFDLAIATGQEIPVEIRDPGEVRAFGDVPVAPEGVDVWNPAFDITPAELITGWVTERGVLTPPFADWGPPRGGCRPSAP